MQFTTIPENNFSGGINQNAIETMIPEGYIEFGFNADTNSSGSLSKRKGYKSFAGWVPTRVTSVQSDGAKLTMTLPVGIDLSAYSSVPVYVSGTVNNAPFGRYYTSFTPNIRKVLAAAVTSIALQDTHGFSGYYMEVGTAESKSSSLLNYDHFVPNSVDIVKANGYVTVGYDVPTDRYAFIYFKEHPLSDGNVRRFTVTAASGTNTYAYNHGLGTQDLGVAFFIDNGTSLSRFIPDALVLTDDNNLSLTVSLTANTDLQVLVWKIDTAAQPPIQQPLSGGATAITRITDLESPFIFTYSYVDDGSTRTLAFPDTIVYNEDDPEDKYVEITSTSTTSGSANLITLWETASISNVNTLEVPDTEDAIPLTTTVDLSLYGLDQANIYGLNPPERAGWVNHIDSYITAESQHIVCGLGGALFRNEDPLLTPLHVNMQAQSTDDRVLGPAIWNIADSLTTPRSRDFIALMSGGADHWAEIESITWQNTDVVRAIIHAPGYSVLQSDGVTPGTLIAASGTPVFTTNVDHLTIEDAGYSLNNGEFQIVGAGNVDSDHFYVDYVNPARAGTYSESGDLLYYDNGRWDEVDCGARCGGFTDELEPNNIRFIYGDLILSDNITETQGISVIETYPSHITLRNVVDRIPIIQNQRIRARRTSKIVPLRTASLVATTTPYVAGDVISLGEIREVNAADDTLFTAVFDVDGIGTYTVADTSFYNTGMRLQAYDNDTAEIITVTNIINSTTFEASGGRITSGTLLGRTVTLDVETTFEDDPSNLSPLTIEQRWVYIPSTESSQVVFTALSPTAQSTIRSTMANESLFLTSAYDAIVKYDGDKQYRAGLPRWNPLLSYSVDTGHAAGEIDISGGWKLTVTGLSGNQFTFASIAGANIGDNVVYTPGSGTIANGNFTITGIDVTAGEITVDRAIDTIGLPSGGSLALAPVYKYYFRLNAVDRNDSITAGTTVALGDATVVLPANAAVHFRFATLPAGIGNFPTSNIDLHIYRTLQGKSAPFYLITTIPVTDAADIVYTDIASDSQLTDLDPVNSALLGTEVGTTWDIAPRAEALTVLNNRLILANVSSLPELTLALLHNTAEINFTNLATMELTVNGVTFVAQATPTTRTPSNSSGVLQLTGADIAINSWIYFSNGDARHSGWGQITSASGNVTSIPYVSGASLAAGSCYVVAGSPASVPVPLISGANSVFKRAGQDLATGTEAMRRFAAAINAYSAATGWFVTADAGAQYQENTINIRLPRSDTDLTVTLSQPSDARQYVNGVLTANNTPTTSSGYNYRSRLMLSKPKFPEIFDSVDEILDINPDDGETITAIIPFFGRSAFGAAQTDGPLLVLKSNSVYVVDVNTKQVKKLDTQNLGCTFPYSVANTKNGVMFANYSGIYSIDQNLRLEYVGELVRRSWREDVDRTRTYTLTAHHHGVSNRYKLSCPLNTSNGQNTWTFVYDHTSEGTTYQTTGAQILRRGAWMVDAPLPVTGWCNFGSDEIMARNDGRVWVRRVANDNTDYRDGGDPIEFNVTLRANMFGNGAIRKTIRRIIAHFRSVGRAVINVSQSLNASNTFGVLDPITVWAPLDAVTVVPPGTETGLSDNAGLRVMDVVISPKNARCLFYRLRLQNAELDQGVELAGIEYRVGGMSHTGIVSSAGSSGGGTNAGT